MKDADECLGGTHCSSSVTIVSAMRILANDIQSDDGVANAAIREGADRIEQLTEAVKVLHDLLHRSQAVFVPSTDRACHLNYEALVKYEWLTKDYVRRTIAITRRREKGSTMSKTPDSVAPCSSRCSTIDDKWSISTNEEEYYGVFDSMDDAIAEGKASEYGSFYVGRCVSPVQPEVLFTGDAIEDWLERHVWSHDEYSHDWAEGHVCPTSDEMAELADEIRPLIAAWLDRCKLRPTFWNIDPASVRKIDA